MEESRIADDCYRTRRLSRAFEYFLHPMPHADAGAHADASVFGIERLVSAQRIAADIACHHQVLDFAQFIKKTAMGAAGAQQRRSADDLRQIRLWNPRFFAAQSPRNEIRSEFADPGNFILADTGDPGGLDLFLKIRFQFFHHI